MNSLSVTGNERIRTIDIIRGFALFGIFLVNMPSFHSPEFMKVIHGFKMEYTGLDYWVDAFFTVFVDMKFFTMFSFLFGLGFYIFISRAKQKGIGANGLFVRRALALLLFGVIHLISLWFGDILHTYALAGLFLLFFYQRKIKTMLIWAISFIVVYNAFIGLMLLIPSEILTEIEASSPSIAGIISEYVSVYQQAGYGEWLTYRLGTELPLILLNLVPAMIPIFAMFLIGLAAGKAGIFQNITEHLALFKKVRLITFLISLPFVVLLALFVLDILNWGVKQTYVTEVLTSVSSIPLCLFYISALTVFLHNGKWQRMLRPLAYTGQMALTNYLMQTVISLTIFVGFGYYGEVSLAMGTLICVVIFAGQIVFSTLWMKRFRFGPFEWIWRTLTYLKIQPMKKQEIANSDTLHQSL
ncbi:DUF418 domain-containing protein [Ornithinibacillus halophilus]|uniref:DUF418 domain-containing protein n=1 Tax=Ornithinibacillus halophilus TaxID=930117 RepID=A0A1M5FVQ9_9BACI|nr:DUF418 domain-containing protein [Ornithinibacillus halophilus]SHF95536.1 uncharacterized protein SAMN05216225_101050 [Ornithinibacillus halophilus]